MMTVSSKPVHNYRERLGDFDSWTLMVFQQALVMKPSRPCHMCSDFEATADTIYVMIFTKSL